MFTPILEGAFLSSEEIQYKAFLESCGNEEFIMEAFSAKDIKDPAHFKKIATRQMEIFKKESNNKNLNIMMSLIGAGIFILTMGGLAVVGGSAAGVAGLVAKLAGAISGYLMGSGLGNLTNVVILKKTLTSKINKIDKTLNNADSSLSSTQKSELKKVKAALEKTLKDAESKK